MENIELKPITLSDEEKAYISNDESALEEITMFINKDDCNIKVKTYGDVIRHMTNVELALFLSELQAEIELGILAVMRAKMYPHRKCGEEPRVKEKTIWSSFYNFMEHRVNEEEYNYGDVWGVENWQDLMQWESKDKKNFGMNVDY